MKIKILPFLVLVLISQFAIAQSDTLNRIDVNNKKIGWWIVYLDKDLGITEDTSKANYYRYSYFDDKFDYYNMSRIGTKRNPVIVPTSIKRDQDIIPLEGEYKANYNNGQTRFILIAQNGKLKEYKEFYKNGALKTRYDYTESCGDTSFHYCIYLYKKDESLKYKATLRTPK